jgi:L-threonylcarbamoyladenylate synthase
MAEVVYIDPAQPSTHLIHQVAEVIKGGGIIIYPTETLYGLGTNPFNLKAGERLYRIKGRKAGKPIPFLIKDQEMLETLVTDVSPMARQLMEQHWPGPLTLIFRAKEGLPSPLRGEAGTIGVRISAHPIARLIVEAVDAPLTSTSANTAGGKNLTDARSIADLLGDQVDLIIDGGEVAGQGSTVVDLTTTPPTVVREGMIKVPPHF